MNQSPNTINEKEHQVCSVNPACVCVRWTIIVFVCFLTAVIYWSFIWWCCCWWWWCSLNISPFAFAPSLSIVIFVENSVCTLLEFATVSVLLLLLTHKHECNSKNKTFNSHRNCLKRGVNQINSGGYRDKRRMGTEQSENFVLFYTEIHTTSIHIHSHTRAQTNIHVKPTEFLLFFLRAFDSGRVG